METLGYITALVIGVSLGLLGGGGSVLAIPVLVYLFGLDEKIATAYSLFIVGSAALVGSLRQSENKNIDWRTVFVFGPPAIVGVWMIRYYVVPILPDVLFTIQNFDFTRRMGMFGLFSILMAWAAYSMLSSKEKKGGSGEIKYNYPLIIFEGLAIGAVTGFVGVGGGFLIMPALILLANLTIKKAIGTSLMIIAIKSLTGFFLGDAMRVYVDWKFLLLFTSITLVGIFLGIYAEKFISEKKLKKSFGYFIMIVAIFTFIMEFVVKVS